MQLWIGVIIVWCGLAVGLTALRRRQRRRRDLQALIDAVGRWPTATLAEPAPTVMSASLIDLQAMLETTRQQLLEQSRQLDLERCQQRSILQHLPLGVAVLDDAHTVIFANAALLQLLSIASEQPVIGRRVWEAFRHRGLLEGLRHQQRAFEVATYQPSRTLAVRTLPYDDAGAARQGLMVIVQDITDLRRLEQLRHEFFANISHELKTPLAAIKIFAETLLNDGCDDSELAQRFVRRIDEQSDRLHMLVIDMLQLAQLESQDRILELTQVDVVSTVQHVLDELPTEGERPTIDFDASSAPLLVRAEMEGLYTLIRNLIENAIKYTPSTGQVTLTCSAQDEMAVIDVADTGIGIPAKDLPRIFERFYRVDKARSRELGGTGLGLSIVKHWTQTFGGTVSVTSKQHQGTTFTVRLPLLRAAAVSANDAATAALIRQS